MTRARTNLPADPTGSGHTGRQLVLLKEGTGRAAAEILCNATGLRMGVSSDFDRSVRQTHLAPGEGMLFERLGAALLHADPDQAWALANRTDAQTFLVEPERYVRASGLADGPTATTPPLADTTLATWGLQATRILSSRYAGRGIRVAMLDTGVDLQHPDFAGRTIVSQSFVTGLPVDDGNGHGTFCAGVACGPQQPSQPPRYGIAFGAELYIAKVLDDNAGGTDGNILAGIDWCAGPELRGGAILKWRPQSQRWGGRPRSPWYRDLLGGASSHSVSNRKRNEHGGALRRGNRGAPRRSESHCTRRRPPGPSSPIIRGVGRSGARRGRRARAGAAIDFRQMARSVASYDPGRSVSRVNVAVAVAEDTRGRIYEVAAACRALGLEHTSTLADIGVLTGSVEFHDLPKLRAIPGVVAVELEREFRSQEFRAGR